MDTDRIAGAAKEVGGKVQGAVGSATGDNKTELEGRAREAVGQGQNALGQAKDAVRDAAGSAADAAKDAYNKSGVSGSKAQDAVKSAATTATDAVKDAYNNPDQGSVVACPRGTIGGRCGLTVSKVTLAAAGRTRRRRDDHPIPARAHRCRLDPHPGHPGGGRHLPGLAVLDATVR